jgi:hypothetical protein
VAFAIILIGEFFHLPKLDKFDLFGRRHMAVPPSGLARRRIFG